MFEQYIISQEKSILDALIAINSMGKNETLTLFVVNADKQIIGTLTDGDIRRCLIKGSTLDTRIGDIAFKPFTFLKGDNYDITLIHNAKAKGIELIPVLDNDNHIVDVVNLKKQKSRLPIDAVLMAGGKGERLRPLTDNTPKPLLPMNGKPIIDYIVEHIVSYGIKNIAVTVNYLKEQIEDHFAQPFNGVQIRTVREPKYLGTIGGVQYVEDLKNDTIVLMNSDAITDINLEEFYLHFKENDADISVAAIPYSISVPYGILELNGHDIETVLEKPTYNYYANAGIYLIKRDLLKLIPKDEVFNATDFLEKSISNGYKVIRFPLNGTWLDIGNPQEYQKAIELVKHLK